MIKKLKKLVIEVFKIVRKPEMRILPGQLAFFVVLSIIPIITLIGLIGSFFNISIDMLNEVILEYVPFEFGNNLTEIISGKGFDSNIGILIFTIFLLASNGLYSVILASNSLYGSDDSDFVKRRIKSVFMTIILILLLVFILLVPTFGGAILNYIKNLINVSLGFERTIMIFNLFKWPISFFIIFFNIKLIYTMAPDKQIESKHVNYGAVFTTIFWLITTLFYSYYVTYFANYDIFYGPLSNVIIIMLWVYLLSYIFVLGMSLNINVYKQGNKD